MSDAHEYAQLFNPNGETPAWRPWQIHLLGTPCFGPVNGHELVKRSAGGSIVDPGNVVLLCNAHNTAVEDHPKEARRLGLVK